MSELTNIEGALESSTVKDNLLDIIGGSADFTLEKLFELGEGVPIVSYLTKGVKATLAIRDYLFMEKVIEFLRNVGEEPTARRQEMIDKIQQDSRYSQKFGRVSLTALERFDDLNKATYLGRAAKYLARNEITFAFYKRTAFIIDRLYITDLMLYSTSTGTLPRYLQSDLVSLDLLKSSIITKDISKDHRNLSSQPVDVKLKYEETVSGSVLKSILKDKQLEPYIRRRNEPVDFEERSRYSK